MMSSPPRGNVNVLVHSQEDDDAVLEPVEKGKTLARSQEMMMSL